MRFFTGDVFSNISFPVPQSIQKRLIDYALRKCLGPFVQRDLNSHDLDLQLREGRLSLSNVDLRLETINKTLATYGCQSTKGLIERIEVTLVWTGLFTAKLNVFISGLQLELEPLQKRGPQESASTNILDPDALAGSLANVAQSFYADELASDVGVGMDEPPDSALLQGVLSSIMSNLGVELIRTEIHLNMKESSHAILIACEKLVLTSSPESRGKTLQGSRIEVHLIYIEKDELLDQSQPGRSNHPTSSRSTSTSSYDDAALMQSTVFDLEEGRSIYMSAFTSRPSYQSAILEEDEAETDDAHEQKHQNTFDERGSLLDTSRELLLRCEEGFTLLLGVETSSVHMDLSCQTIQLLCGKVQLQVLLNCWHQFNQSLQSSGPRTEPTTGTINPAIDVDFRIAAILISIDMERSNSLSNPSAAIPELSCLELRQHHTSGSITSHGISLATQDFEIVLSGSSVSRTGTSSDIQKALTLNSTTESGFHIALAPLRLDLNVENAWKNLLALQSCLASAPWPHESDSVSARASILARLQLDCPEITASITVVEQLIELRLRALNLVLEKKDTRDRINLTFADLKLGFSDDPFLTIDDSNSNVMDLTFGAAGVNKKSLEFLDYENLFSVAERTQRSELNTLQGLKQKAKEACTIMFRAFFSQLEINLDLSKMTRLSHTVQDCLRIFSKSASAQESPSVLVSPTICILAESKGLVVTLATPDHDFEISGSKTALFHTRNLKNIHASSFECVAISVRTRNIGEAFSSLVSQGLHTRLDQNKRTYPMIIVKQRYNISGARSGSSVTRIACTDVQYDYHPEMSWLDSVRSCFSRLPIVDNPKGDDSSMSQTLSKAQSLKLSIDLTNVSIGLNPYMTPSKGLLYFRKSAINVDVPASGPPSIINIYAGVVDMFLIDDVEGSQNSLGQSKRVRRDPISSSLIQLGFVLVANLETVEISIILQHPNKHGPAYSINVSGAILTLTTCPDSTATLILLLGLLRLPESLSEQQKNLLGLTHDGQVPIELLNQMANVGVSDLQELLEDALLPIGKDGGHKLKVVGVGPNSGSDAVHRQSTSTSPQPLFNVIRNDLDLVEEHFLSESLLSRSRASQNSIKRQNCSLTINGKNCFVVWNLHDGYDWDSTRQKITNAVSAAMTQAQRSFADRTKPNSASYTGDDDSDSTDSNEIGDLLFNSIYISLPNGADPETLKKSINIELAEADMSDTASQSTATISQHQRSHKGNATEDLQLGRSKMHKIRIEASGISIFAKLFDAAEGEVVNEAKLKVNDFEIIDNVSTSTWRKFLTYHRAIGPREQGSSMIQADLRSIRPVAGLAAAEIVLDVEVLPIRLHVDQDTLEFMTRFFEFRDSNALPPVNPADEIFIQKFQIHAIPIQIDYKPKRVDYRSLRCGRTSEFKNFFILEDSNMILKHVILYGVSGINRLIQHLNDIWLADIKGNQIGNVLAGVSSLRSIATIGGSLKNLVMVPISEYQKDGRIVPGLRKGLTSFAKSTGSEAIRLGAKLAAGTQGILQSAENMLQDDQDSIANSNHGHAVSLYADQPQNLRQGISQGLHGITRNIASTRDAIVAIPKDLDQDRESGVPTRVTARAVPLAVLRPLIGTTEAISKTLLGLRNGLNPEQRKLNEDKYK